MLYVIMRSIRNFFPYEGKDGNFKIENGKLIDADFIQPDQYYLIEGSRFNDGVHVLRSDNPPRIYEHLDNFLPLQDECFQGRVTGLVPPSEFLDLAEEIATYQADHPDEGGPYSNESFGGYSYTRATNKSGDLMGWKDIYKSRLNAWRKL